MATPTRQISPPTSPISSPNQRPPVILQTEAIKDDAIKSNFDLLNRFLLGKNQNQNVGPANFIISAAFSGTISMTGSKQYPATLQAPIVSRGNPVILKLLASQISQSKLLSILSLQNFGSGLAVDATVGYERKNLNDTSGFQEIFSQWLFEPNSSPPTIYGVTFSVPAFEHWDIVPPGNYQYRFFVKLSNGSVFQFQQITLCLNEMR